jgi:hypothetical protein
MLPIIETPKAIHEGLDEVPTVGVPATEGSQGDRRLQQLKRCFGGYEEEGTRPTKNPMSQDCQS